MECNSTEATRAAVKAGAGMGILLRQHVESDLIRGELKVIDIPEINEKVVDTYIIYRKDGVLSPPAEEFLNFLRQWPPKAPWAKTEKQRPQRF
jgi:DNA-binding transcriptional LysR family regulator